MNSPPNHGWEEGLHIDDSNLRLTLSYDECEQALDIDDSDLRLTPVGDLTVTLKDLSGTIFGTIHYKVLTEERFAKAITVGAALILHNVSIFSPKQSTHHYLNITKKNMVKVFHKDGGSA
ncbi:transposase, MuDR, MULE transposase domain protein [Tanacetum coccineum]